MLRRRGWLTGTLTHNPDFTSPSPEEGLGAFPITPSDSSLTWCPFLDHSSTSFGFWCLSWFCSSSCTSCSPVPFKNWDGNNSSGTVDADKCLLSGKQTMLLYPVKKYFDQLAVPRCDFTWGSWTDYLLLGLKWWLLLLQILWCWRSHLAKHRQLHCLQT